MGSARKKVAIYGDRGSFLGQGRMPELKAEIRLRLNPNEGWEARLRWGVYEVDGYGADCAEAVADLLHNLSEFAPSWLLQETAKVE